MAAKIVDAALVAKEGWILLENSRFPTSSDQPKVAGSNHHFRLVNSSFLSNLSISSGSSLNLLRALFDTTNRLDS
jgi:hypothetical protein